MFSRLSSQPGQNGLPRFNLVFILTGGGKLNYFDSNKILEDQIEGVMVAFFKYVKFLLSLFHSFSRDARLNEFYCLN